jgi:hypothetical protein
MASYGTRVGPCPWFMRHRTRTFLATTAALNVLAAAAGVVGLSAAGLTFIATVLHLAA